MLYKTILQRILPRDYLVVRMDVGQTTKCKNVPSSLLSELENYSGQLQRMFKLREQVKPIELSYDNVYGINHQWLAVHIK